MKFRVALLVSGLALFASCEKKFDLVPPDVVYIDINGISEDVVMTAGVNGTFGYKVNDNSGIDQVDWRVRKGFTWEGNVQVTADDFFFSNGTDYDQKVKTDAMSFNPPSNATAGTYRIGVKASDKDNNNNNERFLDFIIVNGKEPQMSVDFVTTIDKQGPQFDAKKNDNLQFSGYATSANDIARVKVDMVNATKSVISKVIEFPAGDDYAIDLKAVSDSMKCFVDPIIGVGNYKFVLQTVDAAGQAGVKVFKVRVN